ncbi:MAG TPA: hydrogenase maturation nickel metallochaperone HypA [Candidatus Faecalibacterium faecipullorum]|uniref:Hydrogenase maturation factor HypA n=1 Tax=Candidatus Faecalibacterium faecipullorum TaxID=2838578 RepID=A0A9D2MGY6_9FIRM|nr:hydrogenase maturation nickel metallochaperone HypA [Candidatus Faecalibacterium faecipullorum]
MHELAITQSILTIALAAAEAQHARRIRAIRLTIGPFSGVVPECVQMYLDVLAKGTIAEGAKIEAAALPLRVRCRACGQESEIDRRHIACPNCGGVELERLSGRECTVDSLEVDV